MKTLAMQIAVTAGLAGVLALTGATRSFAQIRNGNRSGKRLSVSVLRTPAGG
jgi:hypothetical protein